MSLHLSIGMGGESGPLEKTATAPILSTVPLMAEFRNTGPKALSAVIDVKPLDEGDYRIEVTTPGGEPVEVRSWGGCGTGAPLMDHEIFTVEPGGSARVPVSLNFYFLAEPGTYRLRVRYEASRSSSPRDAQPEAAKRLQTLWTGSLESNWVTVTIRPR